MTWCSLRYSWICDTPLTYSTVPPASGPGRVRETGARGGTPRLPGWTERTRICRCHFENLVAARATSREPQICGSSPAVGKKARELRAHRGRDIVARECVGDVGGKKTNLRAAIEAATRELEPVERLGLGKLDHRIGELNLVAGAALLRSENIEDFRLQDVAAGDDEVGRRALARRLLHHPGESKKIAFAFADTDHAVHVDALRRHLLDGDDVGALDFACRSDHLRETAWIVLHQHIRQKKREGLMPDELARAPHRMPQPERQLLAGKARRARSRQIPRQEIEIVMTLAFGERVLQLELAVEMILDDGLVAAGDEDEMLDPRLSGLVHDMLNQRPVHDRQHLLRHGLGCGQKSRPQARDREDGFSDGFHDPLGRQVRTGGILPSRSRRSLMLRNPDRLDGIAYYRIAAEHGAYERGGLQV